MYSNNNIHIIYHKTDSQPRAMLCSLYLLLLSTSPYIIYHYLQLLVFWELIILINSKQ